MKKIILIILLNLTITITYAVSVGSAFSYQGVLMDNGSPANGSYDIGLELFDSETGNTNLFMPQYFLATSVVDGQFTIPQVDFGNTIFDGNDLWLRILVKPNGAATYTQLTPRQRINAVPYAVQADFLAANGANNGDVLQFNGTDWVASAVNVNTPWTINGTSINYTSGKVGIGIASPNQTLAVKSPNTSEDTFLALGSTGIVNMIIEENGNVGIRTATPQARLHVHAAVGASPFRADIAGQQKLKVLNNGALRVGDVTNIADTIVPDDGMYIEGSVKQNTNSFGVIKYAVHATCGIAAARIKYFNSTPTLGTVSVSNNGFGFGKCRITFPNDISSRFYQATVKVSFGNRGVTCNNAPPTTPNNTLDCAVTISHTGNVDQTDRDIMVLVY